MASILERVTQRRPFAADGGKSGAGFEGAVLTDGTPVVIKHVSADDYIVRATDGADRLRMMWDSGFFSRVPPVIDHAIISVERDREGWAVIMRDVSDTMLADDYVLSRDENLRVLAATDALHAEFWGERVEGACNLDVLLNVASPATMDRHAPGDLPVARLYKRGWELFPEVAPPDVAGAMASVLEDARPLAAAMAQREQTTIHGDVRLHNLGLTADRVVFLDWELASFGPAAVDFAWYLIISASRIDASREDVIEDYRRVAGERFDPVALELALIGALSQLGWNKAIDIVDHPDPGIRAQERADLDWWINRVRRALEVWSQ